ncbi:MULTISPECIES: hypothetical protein [unclassified Enterococcus]|uniref:hypothetical protein n=1 Tax=unclassified Enterococcus TaxID=2608891 RepID=UPI001CE1165E|nr:MULTISPECIES: hypothetical protein [unclassified Enterococcus]MCA5014465.1 hypothetical protein [Enterococcus sp. S23]MCA5017421.1 hypothetical protein [Enterococcus sp. S22(2020)]
MIKIELKNKQNQTIVGRIDHEKEEHPFVAEGKELAVLAIKNYSYEAGDKITVTVVGDHPYFVAQLDETLAPSILYLPQKTWEYIIPLEESARKASVETAFRSTRHHIMVRQAHAFEIEAYQNLTFNSHDQKEFSGAYPHAHANVETRDDAVFFAKNAIDGKFGNLSHGSYPFASWGINQQTDAALTIDFGRMVEIDWVRLLFRADYPHDSYWKEVTLAFSDGEERIVKTTNAVEFQEIHFPVKETSKLIFKQLKKAEDASPFPALTQIEVFGRNKG